MSKAKRTDKQRLDWLLDINNQSLIVSMDGGDCYFRIDDREQIDSAMDAKKRSK
jgi:hypothetical protein